MALAATGAGAFGVAAVAGVKTATIAAVASGVSALASFGAQITQRAPSPRGSTTNVLIDTEPPRPYMVGESFSAGILRHRVAYGPSIKDIPNPYLFEVKVFSGVGPVEELVEEQFDFAAIGSYYTDFYASNHRVGNRPDSALESLFVAGAPGWTSDHKLSGCACIGGTYKFDKDGKVFASGTPLHGAIWKGEKVYDPRLDSTYPGGSGSCRLGTESTYVYSDNPALHAGTYAYGRYQNGIKVFGLGLAADGIDWPAIVDWANDCDTNGWTCHGTLYEGGRGADVRAQRVQNLDDLCAAGGGRWLVAGALLSFDWHRPRVPLFTITDDDLLEEGGSATAVQSLRDRMNGVRPQYISPAHNWEQITADEIIGTTYRTEDGQPLTQTWPLNLVKDEAQAGELAAYAMADSREIGPINLNTKQRMRFYRPGEAGILNSELLGYNGQVVIMERDLNPQTFAVPLTLKSETPAKHDFALGKVANPPPTPVIGQTQEDRDGVVAQSILGQSAAELQALITGRAMVDLDPPDGLLQASDTTITVETHTARYADKERSVTGGSLTLLDDGTTTIASLPAGTLLFVYYDDPTREGGAVSLKATTTAANAYTSPSNQARHYVGPIAKVATGAPPSSGGGSRPPGWGDEWTNDLAL